MITPCKSVGVIDPEATTRLCDKLARSGCDGLFVTSSTGESPLLDEDDRRRMTVAARAGVTSNTTIYAGVSALGLKQTLRYTRNAAADGADVAVVMAPFFLKFDQRQLAEYFTAIADESPIPVALYHHPRMPAPIEPETIARLSEHPNIVAIKDTSPDIERAKAVIAAVAGKPLTVLQGNEILVHECYTLGGQGLVNALACVVPEWYAELAQAVKRQDTPAAVQWQQKITDVWKMFFLEGAGLSITSFCHTVRLGMRRRGWLTCLDGMMPGYVPDPAFEKRIDDHLAAVGVPEGDSLGD